MTTAKHERPGYLHDDVVGKYDNGEAYYEKVVCAQCLRRTLVSQERNASRYITMAFLGRCVLRSIFCYDSLTFEFLWVAGQKNLLGTHKAFIIRHVYSISSGIAISGDT